MAENTMIKRNIMTAAQLKERRNDSIRIIEGKNGKTFFTCGRNADGEPMYGYVTKKAYESLCDGTASLSNLEYAEVEADGRTIPCLMMVSANVKFTL